MSSISEWTVRVRQYVIKVVSVYRPPYSIDHTISSRVYFEEFSTYLEDIVMAPAWYSSYRVDCHSDNNVKNFAEVLQTYGL